MVPHNGGSCDYNGGAGILWSCLYPEDTQLRVSNALEAAVRTTIGGLNYIADRSGQVFTSSDGGCTYTNRRAMTEAAREVVVGLGLWDTRDLANRIDFHRLVELLVSGALSEEAMELIANKMGVVDLAREIYGNNLSMEETTILMSFLARFNQTKMKKVAAAVALKREFGHYTTDAVLSNKLCRSTNPRRCRGKLTPDEFGQRMAASGELNDYAVETLMTKIQRRFPRAVLNDVKDGVIGEQMRQRLALVHGADGLDRAFAGKLYLKSQFIEIESRKVCGNRDGEDASRAYDAIQCGRMRALQRRACGALNDYCPGVVSNCMAFPDNQFNDQCSSVGSLRGAALTRKMREYNDIEANLTEQSRLAYATHYDRIDDLETAVEVAVVAKDVLKFTAVGMLSGGAAIAASAGIALIEDVAVQTLQEEGPFDPMRTVKKVALSAATTAVVGKFNTSADSARAAGEVSKLGAAVMKEGFGAKINMGACMLDTASAGNTSAERVFTDCVKATVRGRLTGVLGGPMATRLQPSGGGAALPD